MSATVATSTDVEVLRCQPETYRAKAALTALIRATGSAHLTKTETTTYRGASPWLLLWGPGAPDRAALMRQHVAAGGRAIALDLAYWSRDRKVRVSIDAAHPQNWVLCRDWPRTRFTADAPPVANRWNPSGPILIAGIGRKAQVQYGTAVDVWEAEMIAACRARWPTRKIIQRPKSMQASPPIDRVLDGASLLITWHSNVAVDAIRLGIPVVCRDGAAAAVCPAELPDDPRPLEPHLRDRFLANLAWFQWAPNEAPQTWKFLQELLA